MTNPSELFRFRSSSTKYFEDELRCALQKQEYFFSSIEDLNDPFDCNPTMVQSDSREILQFYRRIGRKFLVSEEVAKTQYPQATTKSIKKLMKEEFSINYGNVKKARSSYNIMFGNFRQETKAICLTESWQSPLHWAHYAGAHSGVAYVFDVDIQAAEFTQDDIPIAIK